MTITPVNLIPGTVLQVAQTVLYTVPASTSVKLGAFVFTNSGAATASVTVQLTRAGGTARTIISALPLGANQAYPSPELANQVIGPGDAISAIASIAGAVSVFGSGTTF